MKKLENKAAKVIADRDREEFLNHLRQQQETTNKQIHKNMYKHSPVLASVPSYHHYIPPISHTRNVEAEHAKKEREELQRKVLEWWLWGSEGLSGSQTEWRPCACLFALFQALHHLIYYLHPISDFS